jgi:hypothetical protein
MNESAGVDAEQAVAIGIGFLEGEGDEGVLDGGGGFLGEGMS